MKNVIVTGATGFIGNALVNKLSSSGINVFAIVRNPDKYEMFKGLNNVTVIISDMSNISKLPEHITNVCIDTFYHLAWEGTSGNGRSDYKLQLNNVKYSCDAVTVAKKMGCKKFVFAGSIMEYESIKYVPIRGSHPELNYIYRTAKLTAHYMSKAISANIGIDFICAIVSNVYGEGEVSFRFINSTLRKFMNCEKASFTSGNQLYDFIYISDAVDAFTEIGRCGRPFSNYYIGNKKQRPLKDFILIMRDCVEKDIQLGLGEIPYDGVSLDYTEFDTMSLYNDTNFTCKVTFEEGIIRTIKWMEK